MTNPHDQNHPFRLLSLVDGGIAANTQAPQAFEFNSWCGRHHRHQWQQSGSGTQVPFLPLKSKADEEIRTLDPLLGKEMLYH
jgi:hypothetical protein